MNLNLNDLKHDIKRLLGIEHHEKIHVELATPSDDPSSIRVGPFIKTNRPRQCDDCDKRTRYFHEYWHTGRKYFSWTYKRYSCHECQLDARGEQTKTPAIENGEANLSKTWVYDTIDPREVFEPDSQ